MFGCTMHIGANDGRTSFKPFDSGLSDEQIVDQLVGTGRYEKSPRLLAAVRAARERTDGVPQAPPSDKPLYVS